MPDDPKVLPIPTSYAVAQKQVAEAQDSLFDNTDDLPPWPWPDITSLCGKPLPGDFVVIGARPANGKTTFMLNLFDALVTSGFPTLYIGAGSEGPPKDSRRQWAALRCGLPAHLVMENLWGELPAGARDQVFHELERQKNDDHEVAHFADINGRLTPKALVECLTEFHKTKQARYVLLDHIHRLRFGSEANPRLLLAEATRWLRDRAAEHKWGMFVAAQLHRAPAQGGPLRDLVPPTMSDLKETGTLEEDAVVGLLLHRVKKANLDNDVVRQVVNNERPVSDIMEPRCMAVRIGKHRRRGHVMDATAFLEVADDGRLQQRTPVWRAGQGTESRYGI